MGGAAGDDDSSKLHPRSLIRKMVNSIKRGETFEARENRSHNMKYAFAELSRIFGQIYAETDIKAYRKKAENINYFHFHFHFWMNFSKSNV